MCRKYGCTNRVSSMPFNELVFPKELLQTTRKSLTCVIDSIFKSQWAKQRNLPHNCKKQAIMKYFNVFLKCISTTVIAKTKEDGG